MMSYLGWAAAGPQSVCIFSQSSVWCSLHGSSGSQSERPTQSSPPGPTSPLWTEAVNLRYLTLHFLQCDYCTQAHWDIDAVTIYCAALIKYNRIDNNYDILYAVLKCTYLVSLTSPSVTQHSVNRIKLHNQTNKIKISPIHQKWEVSIKHHIAESTSKLKSSLIRSVEQSVESNCCIWLQKLWLPWLHEIIIVYMCMTSEHVGIKSDTNLIVWQYVSYEQFMSVHSFQFLSENYTL